MLAKSKARSVPGSFHNPLLQIVDIEAIAQAAHHVGALLVVDNTFASPYLQKPLRLGADLIVHSTTKYVAGNSDMIGGAVIGSRDLMQPVFSSMATLCSTSSASPLDKLDELTITRILNVRILANSHADANHNFRDSCPGSSWTPRKWWSHIPQTHCGTTRRITNLSGKSHALVGESGHPTCPLRHGGGRRPASCPGKHYAAGDHGGMPGNSAGKSLLRDRQPC